jgi:hypothetical protein
MVATSQTTYPPTATRTKAARRFNVLTKPSEIQKRMAIHKRKTVWFPLIPVTAEAVVEQVPVEEDYVSSPIAVDNDAEMNGTGPPPPPPATHELYPVPRKGQRAKRRFNVLTKPSVAKARRGKPAVVAAANGDDSHKTAWFPQNPISEMMIFHPDHTLARQGGYTIEEHSLKAATPEENTVMMPPSA